MTRRVIASLASAVVVLAAGAPPVSGRSPQPPAAGQAPRDPVAQPSVRRVPVGTSVISGTVTAADTGRPLRGVRVNVNGVTLLSSRPGGRGTMPQAVTGGMGSLNASRMALTDTQGGFVIEHLPAGEYAVSASRSTFLTTNYGQKKPAGPGTTLHLGEGQKLALTLQLLRGGVIAGTVFGEDGDPAAQTQVQVWRYASNNGSKRLQRSNGASTDDRGAYRISGLQPGNYLVSATMSNSDAVMADRMLADTAQIEQAIAAGAIQPAAAPGLPATVAIPMPQPPQNRGLSLDNSPPGYAPVFHPSTIEPRNATMVRVVGGDEHRFIDIQVRVAQASHIVGSVTNPPGPDRGVQVMLMNDDSFMDSTTATRADQNGQFAFRSVPPGKYTILAEVISVSQTTVINGIATSTQRVGPPPQLEDSQRMWGRDAVSVGGQTVATASITLQPGKSISGVVIFDMARPPDLTRSRMMVSLQMAPDAMQMRFSPLPQAVVGPDGRFTLSGVSPGRYQIRGPGFTKSAIVEGKDTLDFPVEVTGDADLTSAVVTVTDQLTEIAGTITDATGEPGSGETVVIAATDERYWTPGSRRIAFTRTRGDGQYVFRNLPPGSYVIAVISDLEFGMQYDVEFLKTLAAAGSTRVTIGDGEKLQRNLRVAR
jgi:protocatechuate 3,4-dioxygenase beta subunit